MENVVSENRRKTLAGVGKALELFTVCWACAEAAIALRSALHTGSVSLAGFGWDSLIEVLSALAVWWRMSHEMNPQQKHRAEHLSLRITGSCLLGLGIFVAVGSLRQLLLHEATAVDFPGIVITSLAVVVMPVLAWQKRRVGRALHSHAMATDARQTDFCTYQAGIILLGVVCFRFFHIWWADSVAALVLVPIILRASWLAFRGEHCCSHEGLA